MLQFTPKDTAFCHSLLLPKQAEVRISLMIILAASNLKAIRKIRFTH